MENQHIEHLVIEEVQNQNIELPMGHRSSKSAIDNPTLNADLFSSTKPSAVTSSSISSSTATITCARNGSNSNSNRIPNSLSSTTINVQIQENSLENGGAVVASSSTQLSDSDSSCSSLAGNSLQNRQIIIKIQLAKMENGNEPQTTSTATQRVDADESSTSAFASGSDKDNLETMSAKNDTQFVNLTLNGNFIYMDDGTNDQVSLSSDSSRASQTAGGCASLTNNNINNFTGLLSVLKIQEDREQQNPNDITPEYYEVLEDTVGHSSTPNSAATPNELQRLDSSLTDTVGCLNGSRRSKPVRTSSSSGLSRRRCRDAFRRILEPSSKKLLNKSKKQNKKHSEATPTQSLSDSSNTVLPSTSSQAHLTNTASQKQQNTTSTAASTTSMAITMTNTPLSSNNVIPISIATVGSSTNSITVNPTNQVSATIWTPSQSDLIIPITSPPQFVVVQCPPTSVVTLGRIDYNSIRLSGTEIGHTGINNVNGFISNNVRTESLVKQIHSGPIVHSQVDFVHCLVPDLEKIINSSFYWGKIDRYEAERLLEGKPEGTFLLRDSAQEEYLFSVTFRKFARSLHARIEQSGHKFGFDCHDPSVFTAPTVTGLLQHYKDPTSVMFFEPMLTIPLHRKTTFSLQELARGVIVTNTTYDGINELGLPLRLREFLKEYYYKQKLRVKPFDKMVYSCT